jgi:hypothetical protein
VQQNLQDWKKVGNQLQCPHCKQFDPEIGQATFEDNQGKKLDQETGCETFLIGVFVWSIASLILYAFVCNTTSVPIERWMVEGCFSTLIGIGCLIGGAVASDVAQSDRLTHLRNTAISVYPLQCRNCRLKGEARVRPTSLQPN